MKILVRNIDAIINDFINKAIINELEHEYAMPQLVFNLNTIGNNLKTS